MPDRKWRGGCRVSLWGDDSRSYNAPGLIPTFLRYTGKYTYSLLLERSSGTSLQKYSTMPRVLEIPSNILNPIEYSYGSTEVSTNYPTFSIAYSIYSTSQYVATSRTRAAGCDACEERRRASNFDGAKTKRDPCRNRC